VAPSLLQIAAAARIRVTTISDQPSDDPHIRHLPLAEMLRRVLPLFQPHLLSLATGLALLVISVAAELTGPLVLRHLIDVEIAGGFRQGILRSVALYAALFLLGTLANYVQVVVLTRMGLAIVIRLKETLFHHLMGLSMAYFDHNPPGRLMARVESDTERLQALFSEVSISVLRTAVLLIGALTVMFISSWQVTIGILGFAAPIVVLAVYYFRWMRGLYARVRAMVARISGFVSEYMLAVPILQAFGYEAEAERRMAGLNTDKRRTERVSALFENAFWGVLAAVEVTAVILLLYLGSGRVFNVTMTVGTLVLFVEYTRRVFGPLAMFSEQLGFIQRAFASADRVFAVLDTTSRTADRPTVVAIPHDWREIVFDAVSFVYDGGSRALNEVSFRIRRGETVALVGLSGGGKSTITSLLLRFYDPTSGSIRLDDVDIRAYAQKAWRANIGLVQQDIHLFPGTVADNLRALVDEISLDAVQRAARVVGADQVVARLPHGYDERLDEGGANLSMGERQLLSFARALVNDPELLILDEATASVDPGTERRLQESMDHMRSGRTALIIAHRLATVVAADRILVVHGGRIVEAGTHDDLYLHGGVYRDLFDLQFGGAAPA
jgi:ATP-binding cassette subfamily B multidrug efflux pump